MTVLSDKESSGLSVRNNYRFGKRVFSPRVINVCGTCLETTPVFDAYWYFAAERQRIFLRRTSGANTSELTSDPVLAMYKFTNSYRASDRVSQYLIRKVIYRDDLPNDPENILFRTLLFKMFNKIKTWKEIEREFGKVTLSNYNFKSFDALLSDRQDSGKRNYSAAYIMPSPGRVFGYRRKHSNHLKLLEWMIEKGFASRLGSFSTMSQGFDLLMTVPSIGPFLAYQFITDINYSPLTNFTEMDFVKAGPGALDGISKCFVDTKGVSAAEIIRHMTLQQCAYFKLFDIQFDDLWGRKLQLIDCQNIFCEISKYSRVAYPDISGLSGRKRIKQKYRPTVSMPAPWYPPSWELNNFIAKQYDRYRPLSAETETVSQMRLL